MSKINRKKRNSKYTLTKNSFVSKNLTRTNLGDIEAEKDNNLSSYFVENTIYSDISDLDNACSIIVGEKGMGKSAILKQITLTENKDSCIYISNKDLEVLAAQTKLKDLLSTEDLSERRLAFKFLWTFIICSQVLQSFFIKKNWFDQKIKSIFDSDFKELNSFFNITKNANLLNFSLAAIGKFASASLTIEGKMQQAIEKTNKTGELMSAISKFIKDLNKYIDTDKLFLLIDDLDTTWDNSEFAKLYTEGLIQAIYAINRHSKLKIVMTILESVYNSIDIKSKDKIDCNYAKIIRWNCAECNSLISKRLAYNSMRFEDIFTTDVKFADIYKYTTGTPRDTIKFFQQCVDIYNHNDSKKINSNDLNKVVLNFSEIKTQELISSLKEYFKIDITPIIEGLKSSKKIYSYGDLFNKLNSIICAYENIGNDYRLQNLINYKENNINGLIQFLYDKGFLGYSLHSSNKTGTYYNDDNSYKINEKHHYIIRPIYASKLSVK